MTRAGTVKTVTSPANPLVKAARALHMRKNRAETGLFLAEGAKLVRDALAAGWPPTMVFAREPATDDDPAADVAAKVRAAGGDIIFASTAVMEKLARRDNPQTVIGLFEQRFADPKRLNKGTLVAIEEPRDAGNLGTIIRTVDGLGGAGVLLIGNTVDPFGVEAVRATMGSIFHVPLARLDRAAFTAFAKRYRHPIIGTHLCGTTDIRDLSPSEPQMLLMGTEQSGLTDEAAALATMLTKIPMAGTADSFNLAVATALSLYELRRPFL
ncbi:MAG: RNA methyltransferase [Pseudomonadota bacterium]